MNIIVDAFGGDNAPVEIVKGATMAVQEQDIEVTLVGREEEIAKVFRENSLSYKNIEIADARDIITMEDDPVKAFKGMPESSMMKGLRMVAEQKGDAFVSAGNSGALVMGATFIVGRIKGIKRAAFAPIVPNLAGKFMLIDSGANVVCQPEMLKQFALMGSLYMQNVMETENPKVMLANIGVEEHKGTDLQVEAYKLLKEWDRVNFAGNLEVRDIATTDADVIVSDGFTGNIILKMYEGIAHSFINKAKELIKETGIVNMNMLTPVIDKVGAAKEKMNYKKVGGAPIMGLKAPVFKAHGNVDAGALNSAIKLAANYAKTGVVSKIANSL